jgi:hypothetical protein
MTQQRTITPRPLPPALIWGGSAVIVFHFFAIIMLVLAAQSGPWATRFGDSPALGPLFATKVNDVLRPGYLQPLHMTHDYHFLSNRLMTSEVKIEARLKDDQGNLTTLNFPDPEANAWVRHRQSLLALALGDDLAVQAPRGEAIPAPDKKMPTVTIWEPVKGEANLRLRTVQEHLVPKDRPVFRPSDWSLLLARSYARYLCREHGAVSVELIRHSKDPVVPAMMFLDEPPPGTFEELVCSFGEYRREN